MAVENRYKITVNTKDKMARVIPEVVANDNVVFEIDIFDGATSFTLSSGYSYKLVSLKPSGKSVIRDGILTGNVIVFTLGSSETLEAGKVEATVQVFDANLKRISTANFSYRVKKDPSLQGGLPTDDKTLVIANESLFLETIQKTDEQKQRVDELIAGTPQPSEIVDSRGGFPILRDRLNNVDASLADKVTKGDLIATDFDTSSDSYKIKLINLSDEVQQALTGNAPALSAIANDAVTYEKIGGKVQSKNLLNPKTVQRNKTMSSTGAISDYTGWGVTDFIPVVGGNNYYRVGQAARMICWYDTNKTYIGYISGTNAITAPANAAYVKMVVVLAELDTNKSYLVAGSVELPYEPFGFTIDEFLYEKSLNKNKPNGYVGLDSSGLMDLKALGLDKSGKNLFNKATVTLKSSIDPTTGNVISHATYCASDFITIKESANYYRNITPRNMAFYDKNKVYISGLQGSNLVISPANANYIRFTLDPAELDTCQFEEGSTGTSYEGYGIKSEVLGKSSINKAFGVAGLDDKGKVSVKLLDKKYSNVEYAREKLGAFFEKLLNQSKLTVLTLGNSITNYQNVNLLSTDLQKTCPQGLAADNYSRKLWQMLNYDVYSEDRLSVVNANGNVNYKRFDHADVVLSGGGYDAGTAIGTKHWAINKSGAESWRNKAFGGFAQVITSESTFNKVAVGTVTNGATFTVTVPSDAVGCALVFMKQAGTFSNNVNVKINNGTTDVVNENIDINAFKTYQTYKEYSLVAGTTKTITVTNLTSNELWIYGVEHWNKNFVRVIQNGRAGMSAQVLDSEFDLIAGYDTLDLIVLEVPALNDCADLTESDARTYINSLFQKLKNKNVPILVILTHREGGTTYYRQYDRTSVKYDAMNFPSGSKLVGNRYFYPSYIKIYKAMCAKYGYPTIDMFQKSVDEFGQGLKNNITLPTGWFTDSVHPGVNGIDSYTKELQRVLLWNDND